MNFRNVRKLVTSIVVTEAIGFIGALYTIPAIPGWYAHLAKSSLTPPDAVFGLIWTLLYFLMGISVFLIWRIGYRHKKVRHAMWMYGLQLALNLLWTLIFFKWESPAAALAEIVLLWGMILVTIILFWRIHRSAAWLLLPYILWVTFAAYLNYQILVLN